MTAGTTRQTADNCHTANATHARPLLWPGAMLLPVRKGGEGMHQGRAGSCRICILGDIKRLCVVSMVVMSQQDFRSSRIGQNHQLLNHTRLYGLANGCSYGKSNLRYLVRSIRWSSMEKPAFRTWRSHFAKCTDPPSNIAVFSSTPVLARHKSMRMIGFAAMGNTQGGCFRWPNQVGRGHAAAIRMEAQYGPMPDRQAVVLRSARRRRLRAYFQGSARQEFAKPLQPLANGGRGKPGLPVIIACPPMAAHAFCER